MSIRAYRLISREVADESSFNLWHNTDLLDFFNENSDLGYNDNQNQDGGGEMEISVTLLQKAVDEFAWEDKADADGLKADIAFAKEKGDDWVIYECY